MSSIRVTPDQVTPPAQSAEMTAASVLALTDDAEAQDLLMELAVTEGFGVRCASTEVEAANVLHLERPGLVLIDLDMPARVGAKFLRALRQGPFRNIPSIAITATNDPMLTVSIDAPVYFKPGLEGLGAALERLFWPEPTPFVRR
jgi:CheY-like chemotaxis protein